MLLLIMMMFLAEPKDNLPREFRFGYLDEAYMCAQTPFAAKQLKLERHQLTEIGELNSDLKHSPRMDEIRKRLSEIRNSSATPKELYASYQAENKLVRAFNGEVLKRLDQVLDDNAKAQKWRGVLTIHLLQMGHIEEVLRLHDINLSGDKYASLIRAKALRRSDKKMPSERRQETSLNSIRRSLTDQEFNIAMGEPYAAKLPGENAIANGNPTMQYYRDSPLRLVYDLKVQAELELTGAQIRNLNTRRAELDRRFSEGTANGVAFGGGEPNEVIEKLAKLRKELDREITGLLSAEQAIRLRQLLFQLYVRRIEHSWALAYSGKDDQVRIEPNGRKRARKSDKAIVAIVSDPALSSKIRTEAAYATKAINIRDHLRILVDIVGRQKALHMCGGRIILPTSTTREKKGNEESRLLVERQYLGEFSKKSRRRTN